MSLSDPDPTPIRSNRVVTCCAVSLLVIHGLMLGWIACVNSPNLDEPGHLASGISHWEFGRFELYRVNPPLVRMVAAVPVLMTNAKTDWTNWSIQTPYSRSEFPVGTRFVALNGPSAFWYFTLARWACVPLCLVGVWTVFRWARDLFGPAAGLMAMGLYCFCPNSLAWGASITPDAVGTSFGVMAAYLFWRWLQDPSWRTSLLAGVGLGLAELAKGTLIVLFVIWPILWLIYRCSSAKRSGSTQSMDAKGVTGVHHNTSLTTSVPPFRQLMVILLFAVYLLNFGFGFEGSFKPLRDYTFVSKTLSGQDQPVAGGNRFAGTWLGALPIPVPENYVRGLDVQKYDFERGKWSYLCGEQRPRGWWYYYLVAFLVKSPIGTLVMFVAATALAIGFRRYRSHWRNELVLLLPAIVILVLVSSQTGFSRHLRYALPVVPFVYIHVSRIAIVFSSRNRLASGLVALGFLGGVVESIAVFPHSMSFFNMTVGGPANGHAVLLDSNIDWGQDLLFLRRWYLSQPDARPLSLAFFGDFHVHPETAGIVAGAAPGFLASDLRGNASDEREGPQPGWFAISINHLLGYRHLDGDVPQYTYFQQIRPMGRTGYSILIYHLTLEEANELRAKIGLDPLTPLE